MGISAPCYCVKRFRRGISPLCRRSYSEYVKISSTLRYNYHQSCHLSLFFYLRRKGSRKRFRAFIMGILRDKRLKDDGILTNLGNATISYWSFRQRFEIIYRSLGNYSGLTLLLLLLRMILTATLFIPTYHFI